jgi:hypothetical protein
LQDRTGTDAFDIVVDDTPELRNDGCVNLVGPFESELALVRHYRRENVDGSTSFHVENVLVIWIGVMDSRGINDLSVFLIAHLEHTWFFWNLIYPID